MITIDEAKSIVEKNFKGAKAREVYKYGEKYYMIVAPAEKNDMNDPFYIVGIADGKYRFLNPLENIEEFNKSIENGPIKTYGG